MLKRIWQQIIRWFQRLFGIGKSASPSEAIAPSQPAPELTNADLEMLFMQLLEGVNQQRGYDWAVKWLKNIEHRVPTERWVEWLRGFGEGLLASSAANNELASRLVQLGELNIGEVSDAAYDIGMQLLTRNQVEPVWEYSGPDASQTITTQDETTPSSETTDATVVNQDEEFSAITLDELLVMLGEDETLRQQINQQLGIETSDPQEIVQTLINQLNQLNQVSSTETATGDYTFAETSLVSEPQDAEEWINAGLDQANAGDFVASLNCFDKAIELQPDIPEAWYNKASALGNLGRLEAAVAAYDKAIELDPDKHEAHFSRGMALDMLGRWNEAIASYDKAIETEPHFPPAWYSRGLSLIKSGRTAEAIASYDKGIELQPDDAYEAWNTRGQLLADLGQLQEGLRSFEKATQIKPDYHPAWYNRGVILQKLGQFTEALTSYNHALLIKPDDYLAWYNKGLALADLGRMEEAAAAYDKAIEIKPDNYLAWYDKSGVLGALGRYEEALVCSDKALELQPDDFLSWYNKGMALERLGRTEEAVAAYNRSLGINPEFQEARDRRDEARKSLSNE